MTPEHVEQYGEIALAMAQAVLACAARRDHKAYARLLVGEHDLTLRELGQALAKCGFEVRFELVTIAPGNT